ncbi:MAG: prolipoprotein diacylglyceryl transferase [Chloroflexota bacterium]
MPNGFDIPVPFLGTTFHIYFYGILITLGVIAAATLGHFEAKRRGQDTEIIWDALFWVVLAGIIGARLWHVFTPTQTLVEEQNITTMYYLTHPLDIINIRKGGLGIPGAIIGGAIALWLYSRKKKIAFLAWADIIAPGVALAQAIGRWGNFFNQELYGSPTNLPWKIAIDPIHRLSGFESFEYFHPLFLYESLWNFMNMAILLWLARKFADRMKEGDLLLIFSGFYAIGRFFLDFLRLDYAVVGGININQTIMAVIALVAIGLLLWRHGLIQKLIRKNTPEE